MLNMHQKYNSTTIYESVLDNIESSPDGNSVEKIIVKEIEKKDWSVYLTIHIQDTYAQLSESSICDKIEEFFAHHPAVREFSKPQIIASDGITHLCKIGVEFYFRSMRQYVKFFYGLLSLIEYIQKEQYNDDTIEVDSDSDPFDGNWRIKRATAIENLLTNAQSFDFEEDELNSYLDNVETYKTKWRLPILNESVLDNIENNDLDLNDRIKTFDSGISYEKQIKVQLYSNQFKGKSFDAEDKLNQLKEILDYWIPYIDGYSDLSFDAKW